MSTDDLWIHYAATHDQGLREKIIIQYAPLVKYVVGRLAINLPSIQQNALGTTAQIDIVGVNMATIDAVHHYNVSQGRFLQPGETGAGTPAGDRGSSGGGGRITAGCCSA